MIKLSRILDALLGPDVPAPKPVDPMEGKARVGDKKCLSCEGHGVKRKYIDRAGDYTKYHCPDCDGTGNEPISIS